MGKWLLLVAVIAASYQTRVVAAHSAEKFDEEHVRTLIEGEKQTYPGPKNEMAFRLALRATAYVLWFDGLERFEFTFVKDLSPYICPRDRAIIERKRKQSFQSVVNSSEVSKYWQAYVDRLPADDDVLAFARKIILDTTVFDLEEARREINDQKLSRLDQESAAYLNFHQLKMWRNIATQFSNGTFWKIYSFAHDKICKDPSPAEVTRLKTLHI